MKKFEYLVTHVTGDAKIDQKHMNIIGSGGYELIAVDNEMFYWKRPLPEEDKKK